MPREVSKNNSKHKHLSESKCQEGFLHPRLSLINYYERAIKSPPGITSHQLESRSIKADNTFQGGHGGEGGLLHHFWEGQLLRAMMENGRKGPFKNKNSPTI